MWVFIGILTILLVPYFLLGSVGLLIFIADYVEYLRSFKK